jgi:hypothetical protein
VLPECTQCPSGRLRPLFGVLFELFEQGVPAHLRKVSGSQSILFQYFLHGCSHHGLLSWASSASELFEFGLRSLKTLSSGQQCLRIIRVRAPVPRNSLFGPAVPLNYLSLGSGPSKLSLRASSASELFEFGLRSLESLSSGQQCLRIIRVRAPVPRISLFGPAVPPDYSSTGVSPSNYLLRASSASALLGFRFWIPRIASFGHQHFYSIRVQIAVLRISISGYQCSPLKIPEPWWQYTSSDVVCQIRR